MNANHISGSIPVWRRSGAGPVDVVGSFCEAIRARGLIPPDNLIADGKIHRCDVEGKPGKKDGAYCLHLDGLSAGGFENHRDGLGWENWCSRPVRDLSLEEQAAYSARIEVARREHEAEREKRNAEAISEAKRIWEASHPSQSHPYLEKKCVQAYGVRVYGDRLVVPIKDFGGELCSLQFIDSEGGKRFLPGGRMAECFHLIGDPDDGVVPTVFLAEGYATAASIYEAMNHVAGAVVAVAFNCGNLYAVAKVMQAKYPTASIVVCADDDYQTEGNPGRSKGTEVAKNMGSKVVFPIFGKDRADGATDFNDLHQAQGLLEVRACIENALASVGAGEIERTSPSPAEIEYGGGCFRLDDRGVFFYPSETSEPERHTHPLWLCSRLDVIAMTRDKKGEAWGRLLKWLDADGNSHTWAMPAELLGADGSDVRRELLNKGLDIAPTQKARSLLTAYLTVSRPKVRARCVDHVGWFSGAFVLPDDVIGQLEEIVCYQRASAVEPAFSSSGTVAAWRDGLAGLAVGNSRLVFAICAAFAGPLFEIAGEDAGGFHLRGGSSGGKTTALRMAASVWGPPAGYVRTWRATANGLEAIAAIHNDGFLALDELGQIDPKQAGEAAYLLANGMGKARALVTGGARRAARWRLIFLSAGEQSLASLIAEGGRRTHAGQEIRLADIDADAGAGMGIVEALNGHATPGALVENIRELSTKTHGAAGVEWLQRIVQDRTRIAERIGVDLKTLVTCLIRSDANSQASRVARRFALVALAGEMATEYGLTGWPQEEATNSTRRCFESWLDGFGGGVERREDTAILDHVRGFIEAHGQSRFQAWDADEKQRIIERAGFWRVVDGERRFYVLRETFRKELCGGFDSRLVAQVLRKAGALEPDGDGKSTRRERLPGIGLDRCYVLTPRLWEGGAE